MSRTRIISERHGHAMIDQLIKNPQKYDGWIINLLAQVVGVEESTSTTRKLKLQDGSGYSIIGLMDITLECQIEWIYNFTVRCRIPPIDKVKCVKDCQLVISIEKIVAVKNVNEITYHMARVFQSSPHWKLEKAVSKINLEPMIKDFLSKILEEKGANAEMIWKEYKSLGVTIDQVNEKIKELEANGTIYETVDAFYTLLP